MTKPNNPLPNERYVLESDIEKELNVTRFSRIPNVIEGWALSMGQVNKLLRKAITLDPVSSNGDGWVSVEDRLPDNDDIYLVLNDGEVYPAYYRPASNHFYNDYADFSPTDWMPLPRPKLKEQK